MSTSENTEAEIQWLRTKVLPEMLQNGRFIQMEREDGKKATFKILDITLKFIGTEESFMLTTCYRATITYEYNRIAQHRCTFIVKRTPELPQEMFDSIQFGALFNNEIVTYEKILPALKQFTQQPLNVPRFFYGDLQPSSASIVLGDFGSQGFRMSMAQYNLTLEHILLGVKYLGNFHGIGFAMRQVQREQFDRITSVLRESRYGTDEVHPDWALSVLHSVKRVMNATRKNQPQVDEQFLERFERLISNFWRYGKQRVAPVEPMVTLCHGDYLRNNVAFKYGKNEKGIEVPQDVLMFDLQTMRLSSPMMDFSVFIGLSAFAAVRYTNFQQIFSTYYDELAKTYAQHAKQPLPASLSREHFLQEYTRFAAYSISIAASFLYTLVEPRHMSSADMLTMQRTEQEIIDDVMQRGGNVVDLELSHQMKELYELAQQHKVDIFAGFDYV